MKRRIDDTLAIEIDGAGHAPLGMPATRFLRDHWQKHPLLIRNALPGYASPITAEDLAGLACEDYALSRLITHDARRERWSVETGPFDEARFPVLPQRDWTLLVQDVDKWDRDVAAVLDHFRFLPDWRIDDVMVSFAAPGGSVGAHVDQYDVFLLQASGQRHWMIDARPDAPTAFRPDQDLKLLARFEPSHEWLLGPGDILYLPPGVPHHGVAVDGPPCLTFSVGLRAPGAAELAADFAEHLADVLPDSLRYTDPDLAPPRHTGEIDGQALRRVRELLERVLAVDDRTQPDWFGSFITRYRAAGFAAPRARPLTQAAFARRIAGSGCLRRHPLSRFAFHRQGRATRLYVAGTGFDTSAALARALCRSEPVALADVRALVAGDIELLRHLVNQGHLEFAR